MSERTEAEAMHALVAELLPVPRSLTGDGVRATLDRLADFLPGLAVHEVPTGTAVLDWTIPDEWNVRDAYVADADGHRVIDWQAHRLHLVQHSEPVRARLAWRDLAPRLHTLSDRPDWIPYRTSYYDRTWGFCCTQRTFDRLAARGDDAEYEVVIDATLEPGSMTYGEWVLPGTTDREILLSTHVCHPQLANDNLAALAVAAHLGQRMARRAGEGRPLRHTVRLVFVPGTLGAIAWLDRNRDRLDRIASGLVLATLGDDGTIVYKQTRRALLGNPTAVDRAAALVLADEPHEVRRFDPYGYDERQYGSPGFDLPVGRLSRTPHGEFAEYHTSADDLTLVTPRALADSLDVLDRLVTTLDGGERSGSGVPECQPFAGRGAGESKSGRADEGVLLDEGKGLSRARTSTLPHLHASDESECSVIYANTHPFGEPQLGRRGLYAATGGDADRLTAIRWTLNLCDGRRDLLAVAEASGLPFDAVREAADTLLDHDLLTKA